MNNQSIEFLLTIERLIPNRSVRKRKEILFSNLFKDDHCFL